MAYPKNIHFFTEGGAFPYGECAVSWCTSKNVHPASYLCESHWAEWMEERDHYQNKLGAWLGLGNVRENVCAECEQAFFGQIDYLCEECRG